MRSMRPTPLPLGLLALLAALTAAPRSAAAEDIQFARHPALTPDGGEIIFSHAGDLWRVPRAGGKARRITAHPADDRYPVVSPDGRWLAFASAREGAGSTDVHVMPLAGGPVRRVTFDSSLDRPVSWSRDGETVFFLSTRANRYRERVVIFAQDDVVSPREPRRVSTAEASQWQPIGGAGDALAVRGGQRWWRKGYDGAASADIWLARPRGPWRQLTGHRSRDHWPMPDPRDAGRFYWVSARSGADNVWSADVADGGRKRQITRFEDDGVRYPAISADGATMVFERGFELYTLDLRADRPEPRRIAISLFDDAGEEPIARRRVRSADAVAASPDGSAIAFTARGELYVRRSKDGVAIRLTDSPTRQSSPVWAPDGKSLYFVTDEAGQRDIHRIRAAPGEDERLHRALAFVEEPFIASPEDDHAPTISPDGKRMTFIRGLGDLWIIDLPRPKKEPKEPENEEKESPDEDEDGEKDDGAEDGEKEDDEKEDEKDDDEDDEESPDEDDEGDETDDAPPPEPRLLHEGWDPPGVRFSPDSRWVAFAQEDDDFNADVWLLEIESGRLINVSQHPDSDGSPAWSPDGRKLAFVSLRRGDEQDVYYLWLRQADHDKNALDWADAEEDEKLKKVQQAKKARAKAKAKKPAPEPEPGAEPDPKADPKKDDPKKADPEPSGGPQKRDDGAEGDDAEKKATEEKKDKEPKNLVKVDEDEIWGRIRRVKAILGSQGWVGWTSDSERLLIRSDHLDQTDLYSVKPDGSELKRLTTGVSPGGIRFHRKTKSLYFLRGGTPSKMAETGGKIEAWRVDVRQEHPRRAERAQVFREAWRAMATRWYDGQFKGKDWDAIYRKYAPIAESRRNHEEFHEVIELMLGELNGSHLGVSGGDDALGRGGAPATARLGAELQPGADGWVVRSVMPDGPAARDASPLRPGDRILAIGGQRLTATSILAHHLAGQSGERLPLEVIRAEPGEDGAEVRERVVIRPTSGGAIRSLDYERWMRQTRALVEERSEGRVGYVHIQGMNVPSLERFEAELYARCNGRAGLVIDVRDNGGGWTADYLMAILATPEHAYTIPRGGGKGYPQGRRPLASWTRPVAVICNERSFSNAEIFSHAIKTTKRGILVGRETAGGVISTGSTTLLDGSRLRMPFRGWFVKGSGQDMDRMGAVPDIPVDLVPGEDRDRQAEAAVDAVLRQLAH